VRRAGKEKRCPRYQVGRGHGAKRRAFAHPARLHQFENYELDVTVIVIPGCHRNSGPANERAADLSPIEKELHASGATSLRAIVAKLNARGFRTPREVGEWKPETVAQLLARRPTKKRIRLGTRASISSRLATTRLQAGAGPP
jgi:hypothetical protein